MSFNCLLNSVRLLQLILNNSIAIFIIRLYKDTLQDVVLQLSRGSHLKLV